MIHTRLANYSYHFLPGDIAHAHPRYVVISTDELAQGLHNLLLRDFGNTLTLLATDFLR